MTVINKVINNLLLKHMGKKLIMNLPEVSIIEVKNLFSDT
jgi:hypothetical protein